MGKARITLEELSGIMRFANSKNVIFWESGEDLYVTATKTRTKDWEAHHYILESFGKDAIMNKEFYFKKKNIMCDGYEQLVDFINEREYDNITIENL